MRDLPWHEDVHQRPRSGASFREFDLPALRYTKGRDYEQLTKEELALFKELNLMVKKTPTLRPRSAS